MDAKPYVDREEEEKARIGGALRNVEDWRNRLASAGFFGNVRMQTQTIDDDGRSRASRVHNVEIGAENRPAGVTGIPRDLHHLTSEIFAERDRLREHPGLLDDEGLTSLAILNVRYHMARPIEPLRLPCDVEPSPPKVRVLKYARLAWLFKLITKDE